MNACARVRVLATRFGEPKRWRTRRRENLELPAGGKTFFNESRRKSVHDGHRKRFSARLISFQPDIRTEFRSRHCTRSCIVSFYTSDDCSSSAFHSCAPTDDNGYVNKTRTIVFHGRFPFQRCVSISLYRTARALPDTTRRTFSHARRTTSFKLPAHVFRTASSENGENLLTHPF